MTDNQSAHQPLRDLLDLRKNQDLDAQIAEAGMIVSEIGNIDSRKAFEQVERRIQKQNSALTFLNTLTRIAAILFIPLLIGSVWLFSRQLKEPTPHMHFAMQEITSPPGVRSQIVLPDGSSVWLNAESTIKFKVPFDESTRDVSLIGEAYFEVKKNPDVPFVVQSGKVQVKVLGTKFNCKAYTEENDIEVVLAEGKVSFNTEGGAQDREKVMKPGDRAVFDKTTNQTKITNGKIVKVIIEDPTINKYRITTTFENESLHQVLELLGLSSPIDIKYIAATVDKTNKRLTKSKIIFTKKN
ncbi:MAG: FecR domain-containing protein [Bacteroidia bacterium]|nr:FecR domain-containing protein [Bacteroidia bacterium]